MKKKLNFDLSLSTHPQPLNCGEVCVWGAGSDSVSGNYALKIDEGEKNISRGKLSMIATIQATTLELQPTYRMRA